MSNLEAMRKRLQEKETERMERDRARESMRARLAAKENEVKAKRVTSSEEMMKQSQPVQDTALKLSKDISVRNPLRVPRVSYTADKYAIIGENKHAEEVRVKAAKAEEALRTYDAVKGQTDMDNLSRDMARASELMENIVRQDAEARYAKRSGGELELGDDFFTMQSELSALAAAYDVENPYELSQTLEKKLKDAKAYHKDAVKYQEKYKFTHDALDAEDFEKYRDIGANIENPTFDDANKGIEIAGWHPFGEKVKNPVTYSRENADVMRSDGAGFNQGDYLYGHMTDEEVSIYNYYLAKFGEDKAKEYLDVIMGDLKNREGANISGLYNDTVAEPFLNFGAGVETFGANVTQGIANMITGKEKEIQYSPTVIGSKMAMSDNKGAWRLVNDIASTTGNMLPSIGASVISNIIVPGSGAVVGSTLMGASSAGGAYDEMIQLGYSADQARAYGLLVGGSEAVLGYALSGISALGGSLIDDAAKALCPTINSALGKFAIAHPALSVLGHVGKEMSKEAIEEGLQTALEPVLKAYATGEPYEAAEVEEIIYSALLGALSSFGLEGTPTLVKNAPILAKGAADTVSEIVTPKKAQQYIAEQIRAKQNNAPSFSFGVTQTDIDSYVDAAYENSNSEDYKKYAEVSEKLVSDVAADIDLTGYNHALRDNDIRHIRNSHGEKTNEKYPVTKQDIKNIPWIVENYDKVYTVKRKDGRVGVFYVKANDNGLIYYLEQVTDKYGNEHLLINKQMVKTGIDDIPDIAGLREAITKKQSVTEFLNDLKEAQQVYVRDEYQSHSEKSKDVTHESNAPQSDTNNTTSETHRVSPSSDTNSISQTDEIVKGIDNEKLTEGMSAHAIESLKSGVDALGEEYAGKWAVDFREAYEAGKLGVPMPDGGASTSIMTDGQREAAYEMGAADAKAAKSGANGKMQGDIQVDAELEADTVKETESGVKYSLRGVREDNIEVYETSEETKKLPYSERKKRFLDIMSSEYRGRTAKFTRDGETYYARFEPTDVRKIVYGDKKSSKAGHDTIINQGADGSIFELVENSEYKHSSKEQGKSTAAHKGVSEWDYFVKTVQADDAVYDLLANVRKKEDGEYVYSLQAVESTKKEVKPSAIIPSVADVSSSRQTSGAGALDSDNSIPHNENLVKGIGNKKQDRIPTVTPNKSFDSVPYDPADNSIPQSDEIVKGIDNKKLTKGMSAHAVESLKSGADADGADSDADLLLDEDVAADIADLAKEDKQSGNAVPKLMPGISMTFGKDVSVLEAENRKAKAARAKTVTARTGYLSGAKESDIRTAEFLSKVFGRTVIFMSGDYRINGKVENGVIYVNADKSDIASQILAHELTHTAEGAKQYEQLKTAVKKLYAHDGMVWDTILDDMLNDTTYVNYYKKQGKEFTKTDAEHELVARKVEEVIGDEAKLGQFTKDNRNIVTRFYARVRKWLSGFADLRLSADEYEAAQLMRDVEKRLAKALRETKKQSKDAGKSVRYNLDDSLGVQLNDWLNNGGKKGGTFNGSYFKLGTTPDVFIKHGAKKVEMIMYEDVVAKVTGMKGDDAHTISLDEISKLPSELNDPVLLFNGNAPDSFVALTEMVNKYGDDVVVAVHINKRNGRSEITKIASLYSKTDDYGNNRIVSYVNNQIKNGNLIDASTKKAPAWFTTRGLQLPKVVQTIIDANISISQKGGSVNSKFSLATDEELRKQAIKMLQDGISAKQVYEKTGYFIDNNGRIRNDVDDVGGKDSAARNPYPVENAKRVRAEAREKLEAEREHHKKELAYNREYWQAENRKVKEKIGREYAERDARRNMLRDEAKAKKRAEKERRKRARGGYISIEKIRASLENSTFVNEMEKQWAELRELEKNAKVFDTVNIEDAPLEMQELIRELRAKVEDKRVYIRRVGQLKRKVMRQEALELLRSGNIEAWADKKALGGLRYSINTMLRNIQDISKGDELGKAVYKEYFAPISKHVAAATKLKNDIRTKVAELGLSTTVRKGDVLSESAFVQLLGEARDNVYALEHNVGYSGRYNGNKTRNGRTLAEWQDVITTLMVENPSISKSSEAMKRVDNAIETFKSIYDDLFKSLNKVRIYNGYPPIEYRHGYFPHFSSDTSTDSLWAELCDGLNFKIDTEDLPTTINGLTSRFRPGMQYQSFDKARSEHVGEEYNNIRLDGMGAVEGIDRYIEVAANVIYLTEDIQKLRALSEMIRYNASDDAVKERIDEIRKNDELTEEEKQSMIDAYLSSKPKTTLSNFVVYLEEYTNLLAGKKSFWDRATEQMLGRGFYAATKKLEGKIAGNMVGVNPASWLTNFIPLTQAAAVTGNARMVLAASQTVKAAKADDGFVSRSSFLTSRRGSEKLVKGKLRTVSDTLSSPMGWIDNFTAETIVRARYNENIAKGMSETEAMNEADTFASGLMGDRSLGAMPTIFSQSNPVAKLFTQYQLEINNTIGFLFKDLPRMYKGERDKLVAALLKMALYGFLYNFLYKGLTGRDAAPDPIGILNDVVGDVFGVALPDLSDFFDKGFSPELFKTENFGQWKDTDNWQEAAWKAVEVSVKSLGTATNGVLEQLPFTSVLGLLFEDFDQGRIPVSSALPNIPNIGTAVGDFAAAMSESAGTGVKSGAYKKFIKSMYDELLVPLSYVTLPFGAGQLKKTAGAADALVKGGSYSYDADGNRKMQYPIFTDEGFSTVGAALKGLVFGKSSLGKAQEWVEGGFDSLSASDTEKYEKLIASGMSQRDAWAAVNASTSELYDAVMSDPKHAERLRAAYADESAYNSALKKALRENDSRVNEAARAFIGGDEEARIEAIEEIAREGHFDGELIEDAIASAVKSYNTQVENAANAFIEGEGADYKKAVGKIVALGYTKDEAERAIEAEVKAIKKGDTTLVSVGSNIEGTYYTTADVAVLLDGDDTAAAKNAAKEIIAAKVAYGSTQTSARSSIKTALTRYFKKRFLAADDKGRARIRKLLWATGLYKKADDIISLTQGWIIEQMRGE